MKTMLKRLFHRAAPPISYEQARDLACDRDSAIRAELAARRDARPEILYYLAGDSVADVRRAAAANDATPAQANVLLSRDADVGVREALAEKIARLLPDLSADDHVAAQAAVLTVLETLARDQVRRVRAVLAEALKDLAEAPMHVIGWLARDREIEVAGPVLQFSPLLSDDDLVAVIANAPIPGALLAIARRGKVSPRVADAIVAAEDTRAVTALLENPSAQIREETLDRLVEASRATTEWQPPLVHRPALPPATAAKLASFVAESLLAALRARCDLDPTTLIAVEQAVSARLAVPPDEEPRAGPPSGAARARQLQETGQLDEKALMEALAEGDQSCIAEALALLADVPAAAVARIRAARSAKGVTALAWKAGLSMRFAIRLQARFAGIAPGEILNARDGFDFPMAIDEMEWMLDFFRN